MTNALTLAIRFFFFNKLRDNRLFWLPVVQKKPGVSSLKIVRWFYNCDGFIIPSVN